MTTKKAGRPPRVKELEITPLDDLERGELPPIVTTGYVQTAGEPQQVDAISTLAKETKIEETAPHFPKAQLSLPPVERIGCFIVINTPNVKGQRCNLTKIRAYGKNDEMQVQVAWDNTTSVYKFNTKEEADGLIDLLDKYCL